MKKKLVRVGLTLHEEVSLLPEDGIEAWYELFAANSPQRRLSRAEERAASYADDQQVLAELRALKRQDLQSASKEFLNGLTALERLLDLLDTGKYLTAILRDLATQKGRSQGAANANAARAKLPSREKLLKEIATLTAGGYRSERDAKSLIRHKYKCTSQALWQRLNRTSGKNEP